MKVFAVLLPVMLWSCTCIFGQDDKKLFQEMTAENQEVVGALVLYPESVRSTIFQACQYPEILVKLDLIRKKSQGQFQALLEGYSQKKQKAFYDLSRYPELIDQLVAEGPLSKDQIRDQVQSYPKEIQNLAVRYGKNNFNLLNEIHNQRKEVEAAFVAIMSTEDSEVQNIFKSLVAEPDVLSILTDNIKMAVLVGDLYENDPHWLIHYADSLNLQEARSNAKELEDWKNALSSDPQALAEMQQAAKDFAKENAFELAEAPSPQLQVVYRPYPYWFGYPYWYTSPWWYPYPYWYHTGYYIDITGNVVIVGLPSFYYTVWFYNTPRYYNYFRHHYWVFYDRYPHSHSGLVLGWRTEETYNPRVRTTPRAPRQSPPGYRQPSTQIKSRTQVPSETPRSTRSTVKRERAKDFHRQQWKDSRSVKQRSQSPRKPTTRKRRTGK